MWFSGLVISHCVMISRYLLDRDGASLVQREPFSYVLVAIPYIEIPYWAAQLLLFYLPKNVDMIESNCKSKLTQ